MPSSLSLSLHEIASLFKTVGLPVLAKFEAAVTFQSTKPVRFPAESDIYAAPLAALRIATFTSPGWDGCFWPRLAQPLYAWRWAGANGRATPPAAKDGFHSGFVCLVFAWQ